MSDRERCDVLIIGAGLAGMATALLAAEHRDVTMIAKANVTDSNTFQAQGGIAAVVSSDDNVESHVTDTLVAGAGLCHEDVVRLCVEEGPERVEWLTQLGVEFSKSATDEGDNSENFNLGREGGHSKRRVLHVDDMTGRAVARTLLERVRQHPRIHLLERHFAIDLLLESKSEHRFGQGEERCLGAYVMDIDNDRFRPFIADQTVLATGGAGKVYLYTSNPDAATGDGIAMAYRAGAKVANMEFFQFHPTCLFHPDAKSFLISEALRGEGGVLRLRNGESFMERYHELGSLAPRDIVARSIDSEMKQTGDDCVYLDMTDLEDGLVERRFPNIHEACMSYGIDMRKDPIPVVPAAHYCCGGVKTDLHGRTSVPGLFACGEVACTGLHGANRLASNSLLEGLVFSHRVAETLSGPNRPPRLADDVEVPPWNLGYAHVSDEAVVISQNWDAIRRLMWNYVGIVRSNMRLERARRRIEILRDEVRQDYWRYYPTPDLLELRNLSTIARIIIDSATARRESRGLHYNIDYPAPDDEIGTHDTILWRGVR